MDEPESKKVFRKFIMNINNYPALASFETLANYFYAPNAGRTPTNVVRMITTCDMVSKSPELPLRASTEKAFRTTRDAINNEFDRCQDDGAPQLYKRRQ